MFQPIRASAGKPQHPKLRRAASHAVINAGLRKYLRPKRSNVESLCPAPLVSSQTISRYAVISSPSATPSAVFPSPPTSRASAEVPDSGPLPTYLAQLRGIHYVGDPNQDPDLFEDTLSNIVPLSSSRDSITSSSMPSDGVRSSTDISSMPPTSERERGDSHSLTDSDGSSAVDSFPVHIELFPAPRSTRRLTPRTCQAAFPPIDLDSPYAPYAPTPPLSPPAMTGLNESTHKNPFHIPKTLRKLPSTASIFRKASKPFDHQAFQVASHSSATLSLHGLSSDSVRSHSKGRSFVTENDGRPSGGSGTFEELRAGSPRAEFRSSSCHSINSSNFKTLRRKVGLDGARHPLQRTETHGSSSSVQHAVHPDLDRTINSKRGLSGLFALPITRMRTYSSLSRIFKTPKSNLSTAASPSFPSAPTSEVHANISALLSTDTGFEILATGATESSS